MFLVEFRLITDLGKNHWVHIISKTMKVVPEINSIININGYPFVVHDISFAISGEDSFDYGYISLFKAGSYELLLGEVKY